MARPTHAIYFRLLPEPMRLVRAAAKRRGLKVNTWIREAVILMAETNPELRRTETSADAPEVATMRRVGS